MSKSTKLKWKKIRFLVIADFAAKKIVRDEKKNPNKPALISVSDQVSGTLVCSALFDPVGWTSYDSLLGEQQEIRQKFYSVECVRLATAKVLLCQLSSSDAQLQNVFRAVRSSNEKL